MYLLTSDSKSNKLWLFFFVKLNIPVKSWLQFFMALKNFLLNLFCFVWSNEHNVAHNLYFWTLLPLPQVFWCMIFQHKILYLLLWFYVIYLNSLPKSDICFVSYTITFNFVMTASSVVQTRWQCRFTWSCLVFVFTFILLRIVTFWPSSH